MPKMKSHSGAGKRFRFTASGRVKFKRTHMRHLFTGKPSRRTRRLRRAGFLSGADAAGIRARLPYGVTG